MSIRARATRTATFRYRLGCWSSCASTGAASVPSPGCSPMNFSHARWAEGPGISTNEPKRRPESPRRAGSTRFATAMQLDCSRRGRAARHSATPRSQLHADDALPASGERQDVSHAVAAGPAGVPASRTSLTDGPCRPPGAGHPSGAGGGAHPARECRRLSRDASAVGPEAACGECARGVAVPPLWADSSRTATTAGR